MCVSGKRRVGVHSFVATSRCSLHFMLSDLRTWFTWTSKWTSNL